jgi:hypothetical protein
MCGVGKKLERFLETEPDLALGALGTQGHAIADPLVVRPPLILGVLVLTRLAAALGADQWLLGHAAEATPGW